jgi:formate hydrogenlyase subunit 4
MEKSVPKISTQRCSRLTSLCVHLRLGFLGLSTELARSLGTASLLIVVVSVVVVIACFLQLFAGVLRPVALYAPLLHSSMRRPRTIRG